ncbi:MAG: M56 family metallopeptidase, partial [Bryobacterales bacterium]|nr:M56 family metallopeptidase [Bryobacterales bacterium]
MNTVLAILTALLNNLWQSTAAAVLVWIALRFIRANAATRYVIWWVALAVMLILPVAPRVSTLFRAATRVNSPLASSCAPAAFPAAQIDFPAFVTFREERSAKWPFLIVGVWALASLWRFAQIVRSYLHLRGIKRRAAPVRAADVSNRSSVPSCRVLLSPEVASPMAVGFLTPAIILPESLLAEITGEELQHVLLHEYAHLARRDDWANLLARLIGAALALHPVAWWMLRQIEREREMACDDWVVARTGAARPYAASLARMVELRWPEKAHALASGMLGRGSRLDDRIELLIKRGRGFSSSVSLARAIFILGVLTAAGALAPRWVAFAQQPSFEVASVKPNRSGDNRMA